MVRKFRGLTLALLLMLGVFTSGCISIEQEIFLQPDGSGELLLLINLPDFPESAQGGLSAGDPVAAMQKFKTEIAAKLPPTIKLKEAKELRRNGTLGFYALFQFKDLNEIEAIMSEVMKESTQGMPGADSGPRKASEWKVKLEKQGTTRNFTQLFYTDTGEAKVETSGNVSVELKPQTKAAPSRQAGTGAKSGGRTQRRATTRGTAPKATAPAPSGDPASDSSGEMKMEGMEGMAQMMLGAIKFRFTLHTPTPIINSNADLVLGGKTALWNCSLAAFAKEKKPIEMKVSF